MTDDLARFAALPYETRRAIIDAIDVLQTRLMEARRALLHGPKQVKIGVRCDRCRQYVRFTVNDVCSACFKPAPVPVPCEVAGPEFEEPA